MKSRMFASAATALALSLTLVACGGGKSSFEQSLLTEASGIRVEAENAGSESEAISAGAITVNEGDTIVISPVTEKGSFHLTITSSDGATTVYDDEAQGRIMYTIAAAPGTYDVKTSGNGVTGSMTVFAASTDDLAAQDAELADTLAQVGVEDSDAVAEAVTTPVADSSSSSSSSAQ